MRTVLVLLIMLSGLSFKAQSEKKSSVLPEAPITRQDSVTLHAAKITATDGDTPMPTPEQQGFIKTVIDGKAIYRKEAGKLNIEYIPN